MFLYFFFLDVLLINYGDGSRNHNFVSIILIRKIIINIFKILCKALKILLKVPINIDSYFNIH
jgi:hypothetical protein